MVLSPIMNGYMKMEIMLRLSNDKVKVMLEMFDIAKPSSTDPTLDTFDLDNIVFDVNVDDAHLSFEEELDDDEDDDDFWR